MTIVAGVKGLVFTLDPQVTVAGNVSTLTGTSPQFVIMGPGDVTHGTFATVVAGDGKTSTYTTDGTEFPTAGTYSVQFIVVASGVSLPSASQTITVLPRI